MLASVARHCAAGGGYAEKPTAKRARAAGRGARLGRGVVPLGDAAVVELEAARMVLDMSDLRDARVLLARERTCGQRALDILQLERVAAATGVAMGARPRLRCRALFAEPTRKREL